MDNLIGKRLDGRYQIEELIGVGGMANVYKAKDLKEDRFVAVKILRDEFLNNEDLVRRFKNESKAIAVLNHPNIVKVYDISVSDKLQFIVMEYIDGITLKEYMDERKEPLTYKETVFFVSQTLQALAHAHDKGIVHRDIKPQNIMLLRDGTIRVMDFGIARLSRAQGASTMTDKAIGSVHYISPEQAKGDVTDAKADIYSVGIMMYEMLAGKLPFESDSTVSVAIKQISDVAKPIREINANVPAALEAIAEKAMAKEPSQRFASAMDMLADIEEFKKNPSISFDYKYLTTPPQTRYIDKMADKSTSRTRSADTAQKPTRKKHHYGLPIMAGMAVAFAVGAAILVFLIFKLSGNPLFNDKIDIDMPNFINQTMAEIKKNSDYQKNFDFIYDEKYNTSPEGTVYDQFPKTNKKVKEGAKVTLRISKGVEMVTVPNVGNKEKDAAQQALKDMRFHIVFRREVTPEVPVGKVTRTEPAAGEQVAAGSTIAVFVSQPKRETDTTVPKVTDIDLESAKALLSKASLVLGTLGKQESELPINTVLEQSPGPDEKIQIGKPVNLVISEGLHPRERKITVNFDAKINKGKWVAIFEGGEAATIDTVDGVAAQWVITISSTGKDKGVLIKGPSGEKNVTLNFTEKGIDQTVDFTGTYVAISDRAITVNFAANIKAGSWNAVMDGAIISSYTTKDGTAASWSIPIKSSGKKQVIITGPENSKTIDVDFTPTGANPPALTFSGTYVPPAPPPSSSTAPPTPTP
ncbi:MAG: Stk1 family PASTA domain-containing Ser/Thr kinase [Oscillospiraceae bacterium]